MLPLIAGTALRGQREGERFAAWEAAVRRLRDDWSAGARPVPGDLPAYLGGIAEDQRQEALLDLVSAHLSLSWERESGLGLERYADVLSPFPFRPASSADLPAALVEDEFLARHRLPAGDLPELAEYARRFEGRADVRERLAARLLGDARWVLLRRCGSGGMGEIWEALDRRERREVAIKRPRLDADVLTANLLRSEARLTEGLDHPSIVRIVETGVGPDGRPFAVLPLVRGTLLGARCAAWHASCNLAPAQARRESLRAILSAFLDVCNAVAHAHARGVVHGDLKPGNVMLAEDGRGALLDWGSASAWIEPGAPEHGAGDASPGSPAQATAQPETDRSLTPDGAPWLHGTPEYMAPEQADGAVDPRSDVYGLGGILHEIVTGRPPRSWPQGSRPVDWREIVRRACPPRRPAVTPGIPPGLAELCRQALSHRPEDRPSSALALADEVRPHCGEARSRERRGRSPAEVLRRLFTAIRRFAESAGHRLRRASPTS